MLLKIQKTNNMKIKRRGPCYRPPFINPVSERHVNDGGNMYDAKDGWAYLACRSLINLRLIVLLNTLRII